MKTVLTILSLLSAAAVPSALAIEFAGVRVPAGLNAEAAFGLFVLATIALSIAADYGRRPRALPACHAPRRSDKSAHPLAA